tara:strand:- start:276 stop:515 length:240 start_codon:yes stop_codon:yes gene_type:complete
MNLKKLNLKYKYTMSLFGSTLIRNIRHVQIKNVAYHPNLFKAIITFEKSKINYDESDEIEYIKLAELDKKIERVKARAE